MCSGADWTNTQQTATNLASPNKKANFESGEVSKDRKYKQLQSSVFGGGYLEGEKPDYDREQSRAAFGTVADWKTEAGMQKPINRGPSKVDTFSKRQCQLASQVLEQTDYYGHLPLAKKPHDLDQDKTHATEPRAKGRKVNDDFKAGVRQQESLRQDYANYDAKSQKQNFLQSQFGSLPQYERPTEKYNDQPAYQAQQVNLPGRETKAVKQAMLASNDPFTGETTMKHYSVAEQSKPEVVDLQLSGLPEHFQALDLKKMSGAKHVISATVDEDNMKGICLGTGRIKVRLNQGETSESVKLNFLKNGYIVKDFENDPRKKPMVTGLPKERAADIANHHLQKQKELNTGNADMFGNTGFYQVRV